MDCGAFAFHAEVILTKPFSASTMLLNDLRSSGEFVVHPSFLGVAKGCGQSRIGKCARSDSRSK
jgi:hypothetical protein